MYRDLRLVHVLPCCCSSATCGFVQLDRSVGGLGGQIPVHEGPILDWDAILAAKRDAKGTPRGVRGVPNRAACSQTLLGGSLEHGLDLGSGLELEDLLGQCVGLGLGPLGKS